MTRPLIVLTLSISLLLFGLTSCRTQPREAEASPPKLQGSGWQELSSAEREIVESCGTEAPFSGKFVDHKADGTYTCTRCGTPLFGSNTKFDSRSGWPSFDDALSNAVKEVKDDDGQRTEIRCARCDGHLGHVFRGEKMTDKNTRHCVNSLAMDFVERPLEEAYFAGGCFWGVEALLEELPGVQTVESGYMGGRVQSPTYTQISSGRTGHAEAVRVLYDPGTIGFETLAKAFFEIHDPTEVNRQGPDVGTQYRSAVFTTTAAQRESVEGLISLLRKKGLAVSTEVQPAGKFWPAEAYHQDYYERTGKAPYCHARVERF